MVQQPPKQGGEDALQSGPAYGASMHNRAKPPQERRPGRADYSRLEELVLEGPSLPELEAQLGVRKQRVHQVIRDRGLHDKWKAARKRSMEEVRKQANQKREAERLKEQQQDARQAAGRLAAALADIRDTYRQLPHPQALAAAESVYKDHPQRLLPPHTSTYRPGQAYLLFYHYFRAQETGIPVSYYELQDRTGIFFVQAGRLLREAGLKPFYRRDRPSITRAQGRVIKAAVQTENCISGRDLSWLLSLPRELIARYQKGKPMDARGGPAVRHNGERLWYKNCLALFRAIDSGLSTLPAMEEAGVRTTQCYRQAVKHRDRIEATVSDFLHRTGYDYDLTQWPPSRKSNHAP